MVIELGGHIKLTNFDNLEPAKLIVVKKIVGSFTKKISEAKKDFKEISIELKEESDKFTISGKLITSKEKTSSSTNENLFFALNAVLEELAK